MSRARIFDRVGKLLVINHISRISFVIYWPHLVSQTIPEILFFKVLEVLYNNVSSY